MTTMQTMTLTQPQPTHPPQTVEPFGIDWVPQVERWRASRRIVGVYEQEVTKELHGETVTRRGTSADPVVLVEDAEGVRSLHLASELGIIF
jgi:hypothetical protein